MKLRSLILVLALAIPGAGAAADPLSVFQPQQIKPVSITPGDARALRALPPLESFGALTGTRSPSLEEVASPAALARAAGFAPRLPGEVPAALAAQAHYQVTGRARTSFTFSSAKAASWAREHQVALHPVPAAFNGTRITADLEPVAIVTYGTMPKRQREREGRGGARTHEFIAIVQAKTPTVTSSGASLPELAAWFAAQPGMPQHLAAEVAAIGDPSRTLPIPIRVDTQRAVPVTVDGVKGLAIGDETGIGSAVIWTRDGRFYAVGGTLAQSRLLALANTLR